MKVYRGIYNYLVIVGKDLFEMSADAHAPNGVCVFLGAASELDLWGNTGGGVRAVGVRDIPSGVVKQVKYLRALN